MDFGVIVADKAMGSLSIELIEIFSSIAFLLSFRLIVRIVLVCSNDKDPFLIQIYPDNCRVSFISWRFSITSLFSVIV